MTDSLLNVFFGTLDSLATLALIFKIFRWPFWRMFNRSIIIAVIIALVSFADRTVFDIPEFDTAIQLVLYIVLIRYILKVATFYACPLTTIGYVSFLLIQFIVYPTLLATGAVTTNDAQEISGFGTYLIQFSTEITCFAVAYVLHILRLGFSYVDIPPHDFYVANRKTKLDIVGNILGSVAVASFMYWLLNFEHNIAIILTLLSVSFVFLLYLSLRKDYGA